MAKNLISRFLAALLVVGFVLFSSLQSSAAISEAAEKPWTADNGNGTYSNSLFYGKFSVMRPVPTQQNLRIKMG